MYLSAILGNRWPTFPFKFPTNLRLTPDTLRVDSKIKRRVLSNNKNLFSFDPAPSQQGSYLQSLKDRRRQRERGRENERLVRLIRQRIKKKRKKKEKKNRRKRGTSTTWPPVRNCKRILKQISHGRQRAPRIEERDVRWFSTHPFTTRGC